MGPAEEEGRRGGEDERGVGFVNGEEEWKWRRRDAAGLDDAQRRKGA